MAKGMDIQTFETIIILTDEITDEDYENASYHFKNLLKGLPAAKIKTELLGKKKLAYRTRGRTSGYYLLFTYQSTEDLINTKWDSILRQDDNVIKFLTTNIDTDYTPDPDEGESEQKTVKKPVDVFNLIFGI